MNCDHNIGAHLSCYIDWQVVEQASIYQHPAAVTHGSEKSRNGHRGPHRFRQRAVVEHVRRLRYEIGRHAAERDRQVVEAFHLRIRQADAVQNQTDLLSGIETAGKLRAMLQPEFESVGIVAAVLFAPKR